MALLALLSGTGAGQAEAGGRRDDGAQQVAQRERSLRAAVRRGRAWRWVAARRGQDGGAAGEEPPGLRRGGAREAGGGGCEADGGKAAGTRDLARGQGRHAWEGDRRGRDRVVDPMGVIVCTNLKHWKLPELYFFRKIDRNCGGGWDDSNLRAIVGRLPTVDFQNITSFSFSSICFLVF